MAAAKGIALYGGKVLERDRETKGTFVYSTEHGGRKVSQYVSKSDLNGAEPPAKIRVYIEPVE